MLAPVLDSSHLPLVVHPIPPYWDLVLVPALLEERVFELVRPAPRDLLPLVVVLMLSVLVRWLLVRYPSWRLDSSLHYHLRVLDPRLVQPVVALAY